MKLIYRAVAAAFGLAACGNEPTPAQEQRAEESRESAAAIELRGDTLEERGDAVEQTADQLAAALRDGADALEDGEIAVNPAPPVVVVIPPTDPVVVVPPANAVGAGENG